MVAVIDYNAGNVQSVLFAMDRLKTEAVLTDDPEKIRKADKVIFPGVGEANTTMSYLKERGLDDLIKSLRQPVLGICLGMQLMCAYSEENDTPCLGIFPEHVKLFIPKTGEKVPHIGWNKVLIKENQIFPKNLHEQYVYFVHSYYVEIGQNTIATTEYIHPFSSMMHKDNFWATQYHPEKSGTVGERVLSHFLGI